LDLDKSIMLAKPGLAEAAGPKIADVPVIAADLAVDV